MKKLNDYTPYGSNYSESKLWNKIQSVAKKAGIKTVYAAPLLYYISTDKNVPVSDKAKIYGALGYFILPVDLIPDVIIGIGYTDDLAALLWALKAVWDNITPEIRHKAKSKLTEWFGPVHDNDLNLF